MKGTVQKPKFLDSSRFYGINMKNRFFFLCMAVSCLLYSACMTNPSNKEKVMTAYMPSKYLKYYIRPGKMKPEDSSGKIYVMIDFSYQMDKRNYVSDAYTNFTFYNRTGDFVDAAYFLLADNEKVPLSEISTLDRDVNKGYVRVSTILEQQNIEKILKALEQAACTLNITAETGITYPFIATEDLQIRIREAFSK